MDCIWSSLTRSEKIMSLKLVKLCEVVFDWMVIASYLKTEQAKIFWYRVLMWLVM